jgi:hypothetical protein
MLTKPDRSSIEITLSKKLEIHKGGKQHFSNKITLFAPSLSDLPKICFLKHTMLSAFKKAGNENANQNTTSNKENVNADGISNAEQLISVLYMTVDSEDIAKVFDEFRDLLISGNGKVEDVIVTDLILEQICLEDFEKMLGEYLENFLLPSWMKKAMQR